MSDEDDEQGLKPEARPSRPLWTSIAGVPDLTPAEKEYRQLRAKNCLGKPVLERMMWHSFKREDQHRKEMANREKLMEHLRKLHPEEALAILRKVSATDKKRSRQRALYDRLFYAGLKLESTVRKWLSR